MTTTPSHPHQTGRHRSRRRRTWSLTIVAVLAAALWTTPAATTHADPAPALPGSRLTSECPSVAGIFVPGTWETDSGENSATPRGLLAPVATDLETRFGARFEAVFAAYPARAMDGMLYGDSQAQGVAAAKTVLAEFADRCKATKFLLAGYSQGADVAGDLASAIGCRSDPIPPQRVLAVGLIADPKQGTPGGKLVGPAVSGTGIRGTRAQGFCQLGAVTAQLCQQDDRYCATDAATNPVLTGLARILSQPSNTTPTSTTTSTSTPAPTDSQVTASLDAGINTRDLTRLPSDLDALTSALDTPRAPLDPALAQTTSSLSTQIEGLGHLADWTDTQPGTRAKLTDATDGSPDQYAARVLDAVRGSDLDTAARALSTITGHLTTTPVPDTALTEAVQTLTASTSAVTGLGTDVLAQAGPVLSMLKPSTLIDQTVTVASSTIDFAAAVPAILETLGRIGGAVTDPATDLAGKVRAVHEIFGRLNTLCEPLVRLAAGIDLNTVAGLLRLIPDPHGIAATASVIVSLLSDLDVLAWARQAGQLQEDLWRILETLTGGADLLAIGTAFADLVPTVLGFATLAVNTLTGTTTNSTPDTTTAPQSTSDLSILATDLTAANTNGDGGEALSQLVEEGIDAATFFTSGAHQSYDSYVVDSAGRTALTWLADWFGNRIRQVGAA